MARKEGVKPHARVEVEAAVGEALDGGGGAGREEGAELVAVQHHRQPTRGAAGQQHLFDRRPHKLRKVSRVG